MQSVEGDTEPNYSQLGAIRKWVVSTTLRPLYPGENLVPILEEVG